MLGIVESILWYDLIPGVINKSVVPFDNSMTLGHT